jgi:hypothetical protein
MYMMDKSVNAFYENSSKINFIRQVLENELKKIISKQHCSYSLIELAILHIILLE